MKLLEADVVDGRVGGRLEGLDPDGLEVDWKGWIRTVIGRDVDWKG